MRENTEKIKKKKKNDCPNLPTWIRNATKKHSCRFSIRTRFPVENPLNNVTKTTRHLKNGYRQHGCGWALAFSYTTTSKNRFISKAVRFNVKRHTTEVKQHDFISVTTYLFRRTLLCKKKNKRFCLFVNCKKYHILSSRVTFRGTVFRFTRTCFKINFMIITIATRGPGTVFPDLIYRSFRSVSKTNCFS